MPFPIIPNTPPMPPVRPVAKERTTTIPEGQEWPKSGVQRYLNPRTDRFIDKNIEDIIKSNPYSPETLARIDTIRRGLAKDRERRMGRLAGNILDPNLWHEHMSKLHKLSLGLIEEPKQPKRPEGQRIKMF
jgi:hypothetical protein